MEPEEVLKVQVSGDHAHFRKRFTTSSPLTYGVPPRTAITGLLGAIAGLPRQSDEDTASFREVLHPDRCRIAVSTDNVDKQQLNINLLKIKGETERIVTLKTPPEEITRSQVPFEVVRQPSYTVYLAHEDNEWMDQFDRILSAGKAVYTPYLGISEFLADIDYDDRHMLEQETGPAEVDSAVSADTLIKFQQGTKYVRENHSMHMDEERTVQSFGEVIYDENGGPVTIEDGRHYVVKGTDDTIIFLQ